MNSSKSYPLQPSAGRLPSEPNLQEMTGPDKKYYACQSSKQIMFVALHITADKQFGTLPEEKPCQSKSY
jgi:hypothetical protein